MKKISILIISFCLLLVSTGCDNSAVDMTNKEPEVVIVNTEIADNVKIYLKNNGTQGYYKIHILFKYNERALGEIITEEKFISNYEVQTLDITMPEYEKLFSIRVLSKRNDDWIVTGKTEYTTIYRH